MSSRMYSVGQISRASEASCVIPSLFSLLLLLLLEGQGKITLGICFQLLCKMSLGNHSALLEWMMMQF